jgi:hypothetical protein
MRMQRDGPGWKTRSVKLLRGGLGVGLIALAVAGGAAAVEPSAAQAVGTYYEGATAYGGKITFSLGSPRALNDFGGQFPGPGIPSYNGVPCQIGNFLATYVATPGDGNEYGTPIPIVNGSWADTTYPVKDSGTLSGRRGNYASGLLSVQLLRQLGGACTVENVPWTAQCAVACKPRKCKKGFRHQKGNDQRCVRRKH